MRTEIAGSFPRGFAPRAALGLAVCLLAVGLVATACTTADSVPPTTVPLDAGQAGADPSAGMTGGGGPQALAAAAGVGSVTIIEDWAAFASADELEGAITRNLGMGENTMDLSPAPSTGELPSGGALVMAFDIREAAPHDFVGFNRDLAIVEDWSGATHVALWVAPGDPSAVNIVFQFREASGEVWRYEGPMPSAGDPSPLVVPLDADTFAWAEWSTTANGAIDLAAVDQYGLYVGHTGADRTGTVSFGPVIRMP